jgi:hypothetical protein
VASCHQIFFEFNIIQQRGLSCAYIDVPGHVGTCTVQYCLCTWLHYKVIICTGTCLHYKGMCCTCTCLDHRGLSCTCTCLDHRNLCCMFLDVSTVDTREARALPRRIRTTGVCTASGSVYAGMFSTCISSLHAC